MVSTQRRYIYIFGNFCSMSGNVTDCTCTEWVRMFYTCRDSDFVCVHMYSVCMCEWFHLMMLIVWFPFIFPGVSPMMAEICVSLIESDQIIWKHASSKHYTRTYLSQLEANQFYYFCPIKFRTKLQVVLCFPVAGCWIEKKKKRG